MFAINTRGLSTASMIFALSAGMVGRAQAQASVESSPAITSGDTIRVWAPTARLDGAMGILARLDPRELVIAARADNPNGTAPEVVVPMSSVVRVDVLRRTPRSRRRILTGVVIGAVVGAAIGAPLGPFLECGGACDKEGDRQPMVGPGLGGGIGAGVGGLLGGVIGGLSPARWRTVTFTIR